MSRPKQILFYLAVLVGPILGLLLQLMLVREYSDWPPYIIFILLVLLLAAWGGAWAGILGTAASAFLVAYWVLPPRGFKLERPIQLAGLAAFCVVAVGISIIAELYRRNLRQSQNYQKELAVQEALRRGEERFRALVTATSDVVYSMSPNWSEMRQFDGKLFLASANTPSQTWLQNYIAPDDQPHVLALINEAIRTKSVFESEHRVFRADGSVGWTFTRAIPVLDANGEIVEWFGTASDITERKNAEEASRYMSAIVESSYDAIIGKQLDGTITSWNPGAERLYGYPAREMIGQSISLLVPQGFPNDELDILHKVANREFIENYETLRRRKDGSLVEVSLRISPILDDSGNVTGASSTAHDISEQKRARESFLRSEKLAATGRLAATIAHEVNNPLAGAMNAVYIASVLPDKTDEMLKVAEQELRRAAHMTQQTLGFYRGRAGDKQVPIRNVIGEVLAVYATKLQNRNITVQQNYYCGPGSSGEGCLEDCERCARYLLVNAGEMQQIISNLLTNGIDALSDGGAMQIRVSRLSDRVQLTIADNGCGIRTENLKRIFEPFFTTKKAFGTGLGLWVTQELVRKLNGAIKVRSRKDKGTVFRLTFPLQAEDVSIGSEIQHKKSA